MSARRFAALIVALLLAQGISLTLPRAQAVTATVRGRVVDTDGAGLPGVVIVIKSKSQPSGSKQVITDIEGNYRIPLLPPANDYIVTVDYPGFARLEYGPLDLDGGKTTVADLTLRTTEEMTETIKVESRGNVVDTESTKTSTSYNAEFIEGLPIIGHNYQDILTLAPGVTDTDGDGNPNVHGARSTGLQYRLDGGNITDPVSGTFGQNLNSDIIEEVEVITSGASAEYGRADGGFANIITKSGGNDFEGKFSLYWQGKFLNGNGANNNDVNRFQDDLPNYTDIRPTFSAGGAILKDKVWYFASVELLDTEIPLNQVGSTALVTSRGNYSFGKVTWQVNSYNKLAFQAVGDPRTFRGFNLRLGVSPDSDFTFAQGGLTPQIKWTSTISPQLLLESNITHYDSGISLTPVSKYFEPTTTTLIQDTSKTNGTIQADYPCEVVNCDPLLGEKKTYQFDIYTGRVNGAYNFENGDSRLRNQIKTDLSYNIEDAWGQHNIKSGIEFQDEGYTDSQTINPFLIDATQPFEPDPSMPGLGSPDQVMGFQVLLVYNPLITPKNAASFNSSVYLLDAWKPRPNLTINLGARIDREDIDTSGFNFFDPRTDRKKSIALWSAVCEAARVQGNLNLANSNCRNQNTFNGKPPTGLGAGLMAAGTPPDVAALDLDGNGIINVETYPDRNALFQHFTTFAQRETENFSIVNNNLAPRISIAWDPWADGKTRAFGNWSRYYDRLFLDTVSTEIGPDTLNFTFEPDSVDHTIVPGRNISRATSTVSVNQVERNLRTPYTDELSLGFERELAPEWSVGVTYIKRKGYDLLQDQDINHFTCEQSGQVMGIKPEIICGDAGVLETDRFGQTGFATGNVQGGDFGFNRGVSRPNLAPDLYVVNNGFNQVLRIGNYNSSDYTAYELRVIKRLHRNWQMQASYAWSKAFGQAESFGSQLGNDPQTKDDEAGYLDFDQRHLLRFQGVTQLPHEIRLGTIIQWASGTPFSVIRIVVDQDDVGNQNFRTFYPSSQRNDQRNTGYWQIDTRVEKNFVIGKVQASGFLNVQNVTNNDFLRIRSYNTEAFDGIGLDPIRDVGRRFELGATFTF